MDNQTPTLSSADVEDVSQQQQPGGTPSLSSADVEDVGQPQQAAPQQQAPQPRTSPDAIDRFVQSQRPSTDGTLDLSNVAGADEGMETPMAAGTAHPDPIRSNVLTPGGPAGKPIPGWNLSGEPGAVWHPVNAARQAAGGIKDVSEAVAGPMTRVMEGLGAKAKDPNLRNKPVNLDQAAKGATNAMQGAMEVTKPLMVSGIAEAPFRAVGMYMAGIAAGQGSAVVAKQMGATPNEEEFFRTAGFFLPDVAVKAAGIELATERQGSTERVKASAFGGRVGVTAARNPEAVGVAGHVGETTFGYAKPRNTGVQVSDQGPTGIPAPDPVTVQANENVTAITQAAARAADTTRKAEAIAGMAPPPPKPGEPGSTEMPAPAGMDDGILTQQTVDHASAAIQQLPDELKPAGILSTVKKLAQWVRGKGTIITPDNKVHQITGQTPQAQDASAQTVATKIYNDTVEQANQKAEEAKKQQEENSKTQQEEEQAAIEQTTEGGKPAKTEETAPKTEIPDTAPVRRARQILQSVPRGATAEQLETAVRGKIVLATPTLKGLVQEEIQRRANAKEDQAQVAETGQAPAPGLDRQSLQEHADKVARGEEPYVFVPKGTNFKPQGTDLLNTTKVTGAGDHLSGTYYHAKDLKSSEVRDAAKNGTLADLISKWKEAHPPELGNDEVEDLTPESNQSVAEATPASNEVAKEEKPSEPEAKENVQNVQKLESEGTSPEPEAAPQETPEKAGKAETPAPEPKDLENPAPVETGKQSQNKGELKPGQKVLVKQPDGTEAERTVAFKHNNGRYVVKGEKKTVPADQMRPAEQGNVAKPAEQEENTSHGSNQPESASLDQAGGGRPSSDTGAGDRTSLAAAPSEVPQGTGEAGQPEGTDQGNSAPVREGAPSVPEQGTEPGSGTGSDTGLDNSPAQPLVEKAKKQAAKPVVLNKEWYAHPDTWQPPSGEVTRLEGNLAALRILRDVEKNPRKITDEERQTLANYVGWGALSKAFSPYSADYNEQTKWRRAHEELQKLLSPEEYEAAKRSTTNAHYTSPEIVRFMWQIAERFGFKGGNVLEPSMGVGNFFGMMPKSVRSKVLAVGNELDPVTYGIAKLLYPGATLFNKDFKDLVIPDNEIDFAIGNVPFGDWTIYDPKYPKLKAYIHDYFMVKSLDKVKPGGVVAFITSTGTMDKASSTIRNILASKADLVAAFRFPSTAFAKNAGTAVTTDLIILQKRALGAQPGGEAWLHSPELQVAKEDGTGTHPLNVNEYYQNHNAHMLGKPVASTRMYGGLNFMLKPFDNPMQEILDKSLKSLPKGIMLDSKASGLDQASTESQFAPDTVLERQYTTDAKGALKQRIDGKLVTPAVIENKDGSINPAKAQRLKAMVELRGNLLDLHSDMIRLPDEEQSNAQINVKREKLKKAYDGFVKKYGFLNSPTNRIFEDDPHFPRLLALEHYDRATRIGTPADIFRRRTIFPKEPLKAVSTDLKEALQQVLAERGYPDVNLIARLQGKDPKEVSEPLVKEGLIFRDPEAGDYQTREKYLSGYVRDKLDAARAAVAQGMKEYEPNVKALEDVQPEDVHITDDPATSISVRMGATWIPLPALHDFFRDIFRTEGRITYTQGIWKAELAGRMTPEITATWGTKRLAGHELFQDGLNLRQPMVYDRNSDGTSTLNQLETTSAQAMLERIRTEFQKWSGRSKWKDALEKGYNRAYNNLVQTEYEGSHLKFPGMNGDITLKSHQVNAVWRILQDGRALLAHEVGAGKTFEMAAAIMEGRRVGTFRKPLLTVPNHIVEQFRKEFLLLYPGANLLVPTEKDFDARNRQRIMSHIATGDYDAIILPHSQFNLMDISPERMAMTIQREMDELEETILAMKRAKEDQRTVKQLEKAKEKKRTELARLMDLRADRAINFDDTGIDTLFVDEAHAYKNLSYYTKMTRVAGLQQAKAKSALRLKAKTEFLQEKYNGRGVIFATGTPVQNTMAELYTMIKYVAPDLLERAGIRFFDDWAANFGQTITAMELSADGRSYKARTKFARFQNVPELMQMFRSFADVKTAADLNLPRPDLEGGKPTLITVPSTPEVESFVQDLMKRAERVRGGGVDPKTDNMLKITTDGRKAATDLRLIDPTIEDNPNSKINKVVEQMLREWKEGQAEKLTQMAFLDLYRTIDDGDHEVLNLYNDIRNKLVAGGVPREQIAVVGEHDTRIKRQLLFDKVNKGEVRALLGSTQKMGAGTNAQKRLKALHHIDLTWRPGDLSQREGRILRQGNENAHVRIYNYLTEKSFDAYMAQTLQSKAEFISQILSGKSKDRVMTDAAADMVLSLEEMKIAASGNPDVKLKYDLEMKRSQLLVMQRAFESQRWDIRNSLATAHSRAADARTSITQYTDALDRIQKVEGEDGKGFLLNVDGRKFTTRKEAFEHLKAMEVPKQNFWMDMNGIGVAVRVTSQSGQEDFVYDMSYGDQGRPPERTMESLGASVESRLRNVSKWLESAKQRLANAEGDTAKYEELLQQDKFPEQADLEKVEKQLKEVEGRLGLGNVNAGSQSDADAVTADVTAETSDAEPEESEQEEDELEKSENPNSVWEALGSEEGAATVPAVFEKAGEYLGKAAATTLKDTIKSIGVAGRSMKEVGREFIALTYPRALASPRAKDIMGKAIGTPALNEYKASQLMNGINKMFDQMPEEAQTDFIDRYENGQKQPSEELTQAAELIRSIIEGQEAEEDLAANLGRTPSQRVTLPRLENYFPHRYSKLPGAKADISDQERLLKMANSRRPLEGSKKFLKQRQMSYREAINQGAKPLGNPVEILMKRLQEGSKFVAFKYMMHSGKQAGMIRFFKKPSDVPEHFVEVPDKSMQVWRPVATADGKVVMQQTGKWYWEENFGRLVNNYISKDHIRASSLGSGWAKLKNATTEARLSWSAFHFGYITVENFASGVNLGLDKLYNGGLRNLDGENALEGLADLGRSIVAPFTAVRDGARMIAYARNPEEFLESKEGKAFAEIYPDFPRLMELGFHAGLRWGMNPIYQESLGDGFTQQIRDGHLGKATLKFFPWLSHMLMKPLFEHYIPRSKWVFFAQMLSAKLNQYSEAIASGEVTEQQLARRVADAVENRFGELNYDNLYWNNTFRTFNQLMFRSASWKLGAWRGAASAVREGVDAARGTFNSSGFNDHIYDTIEDEPGWKNQARKFTTRLPELGINQGWLASMALVTAVMSSVIVALATGKAIWNWAEEDHRKNKLSYLGALGFEAMHPRIGKLDPHGEPVRMSMPTGLKDYEHAYHNPVGYVRGSGADWMVNGLDTLQNKDAFGNYVFNPNDPGYQQFLQALKYNAKGDFLPMSVSNFRDDYGPKDTTSKLERATGLIGGSPKEYDRSAALNLALKLRPPHTPETPEQEQAYQLLHETPTRHLTRAALRSKNMDYLEKVFMQLHYDDAKKVLEEATPDERREFQPLMAKKQRRMMESMRRR